MPSVSLVEIIITCMIDSFKKSNVPTVDIPGAFLQTKMPKGGDTVHVIFDGRRAELLAKIASKTYQGYVHQRCGQACNYYRVNIAIYGTLKAALLFREKLSTSLKQRGYIIHLYDWCIANKDINRPQCTIV